MPEPVPRPASHAGCLLCGDRGPAGFGLRFVAQPDGEVRATLEGRAEWQGYEGILHGGVAAALLDAAMTHCLFQHGIEAVTGELTVRYRHPIPWNARLELSARLQKRIPPLYLLVAELTVAGKPLAQATGKFMRRRPQLPDSHQPP
ncbi:MAG: PaaI family thioesterase [Lentisphaeria bacterium]|jgi:uncharacterized protein (TIGR00369 family)